MKTIRFAADGRRGIRHIAQRVEIQFRANRFKDFDTGRIFTGSGVPRSGKRKFRIQSGDGNEIARLDWQMPQAPREIVSRSIRSKHSRQRAD